MTRLDFTLLCEEYNIAPAAALESDMVCDALANRASEEEVRKILTEEF